MPLDFFLEPLLVESKEPLGTQIVAGAVLAAVGEASAVVGWTLRGRCWKAKNRPRGFLLAFIEQGLLGACPKEA